MGDYIMSKTGLELIRQEMSMQHADALISLEHNQAVIDQIKHKLANTKRLVLLGMGGSHFANHSAEAEYKKLGLDATALLISEVLYYPLPDVVSSNAGCLTVWRIW